ncbi:MAG TPA: hypothetical protein VEY10_05410 [Flavisolibacter sp.]|jgi:hypothetical protein|nr:hypothetical protein [Flavisolibacter sp.]
MKSTFLSKKLPLLLLICGMVVTVAIAQTNSGRNKQVANDTVPKKQKKVRDLDEALLELERGEMELNKAMKEIDGEKLEREIRASLKDVDIDMAKMKEDIAKAMKEIDMKKINADVEKALNEVDFQKLNIEMQQELAKVDMTKIKADVQNALKEVNGEKIKLQVQEALAQVDMNNIKMELNKVKEIDVEKMKKELENIRPEIERSMKEAKKGIERARIEITSYKNLVNALDKDGLLDKNEDYKIEYKNNELTVNGKKLSAETTKKYSEFLSDKKDFTIQKEADDFNIDNK